MTEHINAILNDKQEIVPCPCFTHGAHYGKRDTASVQVPLYRPCKKNAIHCAYPRLCGTHSSLERWCHGETEDGRHREAAKAFRVVVCAFPTRKPPQIAVENKHVSGVADWLSVTAATKQSIRGHWMLVPELCVGRRLRYNGTDPAFSWSGTPRRLSHVRERVNDGSLVKPQWKSISNHALCVR